MTDRELLEVAFKHLSVYYDKHMPIIKQLRTQLDQPVCTPRDFKYSTIEEAMEPMPPAPGLPQPSKDELELVAEEREACAKVCDDLPVPPYVPDNDAHIWDLTCVDCAAAIRARGQQ
jgi:hypothetical protein